MKKLSIYILLLFFIMPYFADAQRWKRYRHEGVIGIGITNLYGDMGGGSGDARHNTLDLDIEGTRAGIMLGWRYKLKELLAIRVNIIPALLKSSDSYTDNSSRSNRGGDASSFIIEPSFQLEYSLVKERYGRRYTFSNINHFNLSHVNTYVFIGIGGLFYFPTASVERDSGVGEPGVFAASFPMGIGFKYAINRVYTFGIEIGNRFTTTDYLDGFSDKFSTANDSYTFLLFSISKRFRTTRKGLPRF